MRRRSTLGTNGATAPVRINTVDFPPEYNRVSLGPRRSSIAPESKGSTASRNWQSGRSNAGVSRPSTSKVKLQPKEARRRLHGNYDDPSTSVLSGISLLGESVLERNDCTLNPVPEAAEKAISSQIKEDSKAANVGKVSLKTSETKIPKLNIHSVKKQDLSVSRFNSTAVFEEEEIAALTSTPQVIRSHNPGLSMPTVANVDFSALSQQMSLLALDQRSAMQVIKLSFQKMNVLMDKQIDLANKQSKLVSMQMEVYEKLENHLSSTSKKSNVENPNSLDSEAFKVSPESTSDALKSFSSLEVHPEILESSSKPITEKHDAAELEVDSPNEENKENSFLRIPQSLSLYVNMKSQINCLKTPTQHKAGLIRRSVETPNTVLSNRVHNQLENLFETSETDE